MDWMKTGKGVPRGCILSPCLFKLYAEYIMRNARLDELQAGINITVRNINNFRYADDTTLMAESEELTGPSLKVKEETEKASLNMASGPITSWQIDGENVKTMSDFILLGSKINVNGEFSHKIKRRLLLRRITISKPDIVSKSRDIPLPTKVHIVKAMIFAVVVYGCENWIKKKAENRRTDAFEL